MRRSNKRRQSGAMADIGPALWLLLLGLTFPLLDLGCIAFRYTFLLGASRDAAQIASECSSFITDISASSPSATTAATNQATANCNSFAGIHLVSVNTDLVLTNISTGVQTKQTTPLTQPADTSTYMYQIEVRVTADVDPLLKYASVPFVGNIPGLTSPFRFIVASQQLCENPDGMTQ